MSNICTICTPDEFKRRHHNSKTNEDQKEHVSESEVECSDDAASDDDSHRQEDSHHQVDSESHHRSPRSADRQYKHHHRSDMKKVLMPSGKSFYIKTLASPRWRCGDRPRLVTLRPRGKMGRREFDIVAHEMGGAIVHLPRGTNAGGVFCAFYVVRIQKILQGCAWRRYLNRQQDILLEGSQLNERMLFHGAQNVSTIIANGFDERNAYGGGKLGAGIYFTQYSSVANQFAFGFYGGKGCPLHQDKSCYICDRYMLLCRVTLGRSRAFPSTSMGQMSHPPPEHHSAVGVPGEGTFDFPEYVVYRGEQAYPEYLITYRLVKPEPQQQC